MWNDNRIIDYVEDRFGDGECGVFAQALGGMTGLPVVLFRVDGSHYGPVFPHSFPRHAAVMVGNDHYLDGYGISSLSETAQRFGMRLRVDSSPSPTAYPFGSAPGQRNFDPEEYSEVETHALLMLVVRDMDHLVSDHEFDRIVAADERELLIDLPRVGSRISRSTAP